MHWRQAGLNNSQFGLTMPHKSGIKELSETDINSEQQGYSLAVERRRNAALYYFKHFD